MAKAMPPLVFLPIFKTRNPFGHLLGLRRNVLEYLQRVAEACGEAGYFKAGPRVCIGESFAWLEGTLVLATLAQCWKLRLVPDHPVELKPLITLRPKFGMKMRLQRRNIAEAQSLTPNCSTTAWPRLCFF